MTDAATALPQAPAPPARRRYTWKRLLGFCFFVFVLASGIYLGGLYYIAHITPPDVGTQSISIDVPRSLEKPGSVAFAKKTRLNILCLGVDYNYNPKGIHYTKWVRSDTLFLLSVDSEARLLNMLSIPRDCRVEIPGVGLEKINAAFSMKETGDIDLVRRTVEKFLGITVDRYIIIKEYAAKKMVDDLGGVTVDVEKNMDYDDNWGNLHIHLKKGVQRLNGEQAVGYVRFRNDEEGDRGRIRRQQQFLDALFKELRKPENSMNPSRLQALATTIHDNIGTDLTVGEIIDLANLYKRFDRKRIQRARIDGEDVNVDGLAYIQPDEREKERTVYRMLVDPNGIAPESIRVEVLNASSVVGSAQAVADVLKAKGYQIVNVDVTRKSSESFIEDHRDNKDALASVRQMLGDLPIRTRREETRADVTIVLGEDWKTHYKPYEHAIPNGSPAPMDSPRPAEVPMVDVPAPAWTPPSTNAPGPQRPAPVSSQEPASPGPDVVLPTAAAPPLPGHPTPTAEAPDPNGARF